MSQPQPIEPPVVHPTFGELITKRKASAVAWVVLAVAAIVVLFAGAATWGSLLPLVQPSPANPFEPIFFIIAFSILLGTIGVGWFAIQTGRTRYEFYATGACIRRGEQTLLSMPYADVEKFRFLTVRQYLNGIYAGTSLDITLIDGAKRKLQFKGNHKERSAGLGLTIFFQRFKGTDELDIVRILIAEQMLPRLSRKLADEGSVLWCDGVQLSATGITPKRGPHKKTLVPYASISGVHVENGVYHAFLPNEKKSFLFLALGDENFWPGLLLFESLIEQYQTLSDANAPGAPRSDATPNPS